MESFQDINWADMAIKAGIALLILIVTWILAKLVKAAFSKLVQKVPAMQRLGSDGKSLGDSLGTIASLVVWLLGLVAILNVFNLNQALSPITSMLDNLLSYIPNIIGAAFVFFIGLLIARIARQLIETSLSTVNFDKWIAKAGGTVGDATDLDRSDSHAAARTETGSTATGVQSSTVSQSSTGNKIGSTIATIVYALILIVVSIAALQIVGISSISDPAEQMLTGIFNAIPNILAAAIILGIGVVIARFAGDLLGQVISGLGIDNALRDADILPEGRSAVPTISKVVQVAIVLFFAVMAAQMLGFPQITNFLSEVLELGGKVLFGGAIIAAGFYIAQLLAKTVTGNAGQVIKWATIILFTAMGLKYMGVADSIINLAFGALVVGGAAAAALAFGLGGKDAAARTLNKLEEKADQPTTAANREDVTGV